MFIFLQMANKIIIASIFYRSDNDQKRLQNIQDVKMLGSLCSWKLEIGLLQLLRLNFSCEFLPLYELTSVSKSMLNKLR